MKTKQLYFFLLMVVLFLTGCAIHLEKRKYMKGYYVSFKKKDHFQTHKNLNDTACKMASSLERKVVRINEIPHEEERLMAINLGLTNPFINETRKPETNIAPNKEKMPVVNSNKVNLAIRQLLPDNPKKQSKSSGLWFFLSLLLIPFIGKGKQSNKISRWANSNKTASRSLFAVCNLVGFGSSFGLGYTLPLELEQWMGSLPIIFALGGYWLYNNKIQGWNQIERKRKAFGIISLACTFGGFYFGNKLQPEQTSEHVVPIAVGVILTLLMLIAYLFALYGLAVLACNLSCSGYEVAAFFVLFGGGIGLGILLVLASIALFKKRKPKTSPKDDH